MGKPLPADQTEIQLFCVLLKGIRRVVHELGSPAATSEGSAERSVIDKRGFVAQENRRASCEWYSNILMPPNYVERAAVLADVRNRLLTDAHAIALTSKVHAHKPS